VDFVVRGRPVRGGDGDGVELLRGVHEALAELANAGLGGISFYLLSVAMQNVPVGTAYAVWTAIGASGAVLLGILLLGEPANLLRIAGIVVVLGGVLMLRLAEG
jgi:quaternary ammonium compound-resistance protein SugE